MLVQIELPKAKMIVCTGLEEKNFMIAKNATKKVGITLPETTKYELAQFHYIKIPAINDSSGPH